MSHSKTQTGQELFLLYLSQNRFREHSDDPDENSGWKAATAGTQPGHPMLRAFHTSSPMWGWNSESGCTIVKSQWHLTPVLK